MSGPKNNIAEVALFIFTNMRFMVATVVRILMKDGPVAGIIFVVDRVKPCFLIKVKRVVNQR